MTLYPAKVALVRAGSPSRPSLNSTVDIFYLTGNLTLSRDPGLGLDLGPRFLMLLRLCHWGCSMLSHGALLENHLWRNVPSSVQSVKCQTCTERVKGETRLQETRHAPKSCCPEPQWGCRGGRGQEQQPLIPEQQVGYPEAGRLQRALR